MPREDSLPSLILKILYPNISRVGDSQERYRIVHRGNYWTNALCTSPAVVGGSMLALRISQRTVATVGGLLFFGFSVSSYFYPPLQSMRFFRKWVLETLSK
ncbi:hypothetical protein ARALYDRAFT_892785 [Arabidopsis lyrata subsp. lyrata]|uniref:GDT1 family protein n=1 Tax=Arabidopsis lyrata subsp. lyrata TaxID=81972 RepID=D7KAY2_ARALL|nr:hypothetical protein ARALYDRAFT_892785 [Arabidopsis lyrata subsp. lyrata]